MKILCILGDNERISYRSDMVSGDLFLEQFTDPQEAIRQYESEYYHAIISVAELKNYSSLDFLRSIRSSGNNIPFIEINSGASDTKGSDTLCLPDLYCEPEIITKYPELILEKIIVLINSLEGKKQKTESGCCQNFTFLNCFNEAVAILDKKMNLLSFNTYFLRTANEYGCCHPVSNHTLMEIFPFLPARMVSIFRSVFSSRTPITYNHEFLFDEEPVFLKIEGIPISQGSRVENLMIKIKNTTREKTILAEYRSLENRLQARILRRTDELKKSMEMLDSNKLEISRNLTLKHVLFEIAEAAVSTINQDQLFKRIHESLSRILNAESFYIGIHEEGSFFSFPYCIDEYDDPVDGKEDMTGSLTLYIFNKGEGMLIDESKHLELAREGVDLIGQPSMQWMGVPLVANGKKLGIMVVQSYSEEELYTEDDLAIMNYVSNQVASAIARARQHERLVGSRDELELRVQERTRELAVANENLTREIKEKEKSETVQSVIFNITDETFKAPGITELAQFIFQQLGRLFHVPNFFVCQYNQETKEYHFPYYIDEKDDIGKWPSKMEGSYTEYMRRTAEPLFFCASDYPRMKEEGMGVGVGSAAKCWMGSPLKTDKGVIGAIVVQSYTDEKAYSEEDFRVLRYISQQVAASIQKKQSELDIKNLVEDLKKRNDELAFLNKELKAYTYSVSHDLRAPLRHIIGYSGLINDEYRDQIDEIGQKYLNNISESCLKMNDMVDAFHKLSRINSYELTLEEVNISELAAEIATSLDRQNQGNNISFQIEENLVAWCDKALVGLMLTNLLSNAVKFSSKEKTPEISLYLEKKKGKDYFVVKDNGVGFDQTKAEMLFIPFQRMHSTSEFDGTGVGLATVYRIIKRHGGSIEACSTVGSGAAFSFHLPENKN